MTRNPKKSIRIWCSQVLLDRANFVARAKGITTAEYAKLLLVQDVDQFELAHGSLPVIAPPSGTESPDGTE